MGTGFYIFFTISWDVGIHQIPNNTKNKFNMKGFQNLGGGFKHLLIFSLLYVGLIFNLNIFQNGLAQTPSVVTILGRLFFSTPSLLLQEFVTIMFSNRFWKPSMDTGHLHSTCQRVLKTWVRCNPIPVW